MTEHLSPMTNLMDGAIVFQNLFNGAAMTEPEGFGAPKKFSILTDGPAPTFSFAHKGMMMPFPFSLAARTKPDGAQASAIHGKIKSAFALGAKKSKGKLGCLRVVGLHEDPNHASASPIGLPEAWQRRVLATKAWGRSDAQLELVPKIDKWWCPKSGRNGLAVVLALQRMRRLDSNFKERAANIVEGENAEGQTMQRLAIGKKRPLID